MDDLTAAFVGCFRDQVDTPPPAGCTVEPGVVRSAVEECLQQRLVNLLPRVFVVEFHAFRERAGLPADPTSTTAMRRFLDRLGPAEAADWMQRHPVLGDLVARVVDDSLAHVRELCARWDADRHDLAARGMLPAPDVTVTALEHLDSDPHHGGRMVAAVRTDRGSLIYKPRSLAPEAFLRECLAEISDDVGLSLAQCVPESVDRGTHGWQEEVRCRPAADEGEAHHYFRAFGAVAALLGALGSTDMHQDNLLAVGDHPALVDLETVLHADALPAPQTLADALGCRVRHSVAGTVLFPQRLPSGPYSVLMGGLGVPQEQQSSRTRFVLVNRDTDAVDIARRTFSYRHGANVLTFPDGSVADPVAHADDVRAGLAAGHRAIAARRGRLVQLVGDRPMPIRQILRATAVYGQLLEAASHPDNLRSWSDVERILDLMGSPPQLGDEAVRGFVARGERAAMLRGEIPRFSVPSDGVRLSAGEDSSMVFCSTSPAEVARPGLDRAGQDAAAFDSQLFEDGLAELRDAATTKVPQRWELRGGPFAGWLGPDGPEPEGVLRHLVRTAVAHQGSDGRELGFVVGTFAPNLPTYEPGTAVGLHDSGGVAVLAGRAAAAGVVVDQTWAADVRRGTRSLQGIHRAALDETPLSPVASSYSVDLALDPAASRLPAAEDAVRAALDDHTPRHAQDFLLGVAGAGLVLAGLPGTPAELLSRVLETIDLDVATPKGRWDLAHGTVGLVWSRYRLAAALDDQACVESTVDAFLAAVAADVAPTPAGWCNGLAGRLLVASEMTPDADSKLLWDLARRATTLAPGAPVDLSVCHGAAGVVQVLLAVGARLETTWPVDLATDYWVRVSAQAREAGYVTGYPTRQSLLGYFLGWSGVADTALLLRQARAGRTGWIPLTLSAHLATSRQVVAA